MKKKIIKIISIIMFVFGAIFIIFSWGFGEDYFSLSDNVTYIIYGIYILIMIGLLVFSLINERKNGE